MTIADHLKDAHARLASTQFAEAFDALLAAWRVLRADEIAELCEMLSERVARHHSLTSLTPHDPTIRTDRVVAWTRAFRSRTPLRLGVLIADIDAVLLDKTPPRFLFPRIEAIANVQDDPRITKVMIRVATHIEAGRAWRKLIPQCVRAFHAASDPRFVSLLRHAAETNASAPAFVRGSLLAEKSKALQKLRKKMDEESPLLPDELSSFVDAIRASIEAIPPDLVIALPAAKTESADPRALFADVYENPDDDDLRLVLADALMAVQDPRGEFILLQCRRARDEHAEDEDRSKSLSRERALFAEHRHAWLGPLASVVPLGSAVFERGFLDRCEAAVSKRVDAEVHYQHADWATVRSIEFRGESRITPVMKSLREASGVDATGLAQLASAGHARLERLGLAMSAVWQGGQIINDSLTAFIRCEKLLALTHLDLPMPGKPDWIWKAVWSAQVRSIGVVSGAASVWMNELRRRDDLEEVSFYGAQYRVIVRREEQGGRFAVVVHLETPELDAYRARGLEDVLRELLATRERFHRREITTPPHVRLADAQRTSLEKTLARFIK